MTIMNPGEYTHPDVLRAALAGEDWAERETDPTRIDWQGRQSRALIPFLVIEGRPVNPGELTGRLGRNEMGLWGETPCADALVTATTNEGTLRWLLMVERGDGYGWAVPGGRIEAGEDGVRAAIRELGEETGLLLDTGDVTRVLPARYVPDPRSSDEAWAVTVPVHFGFACRVTELPQVAGADDARRAAWVPAQTYDELAVHLEGQYFGQAFAAHRQMLREFLDTPGLPGDDAPQRPSLSFRGEPDGVKEALRMLEILEGLPSDDHASITATGLAAVTHALLALRETVADSSDDLASILDSGLTGISDEVSDASRAVNDVAETIEDSSWRGLALQLASRVRLRRSAARVASPIGGHSSR
jgi:ADP-ribose pyrophosphatase